MPAAIGMTGSDQASTVVEQPVDKSAPVLLPLAIEAVIYVLLRECWLVLVGVACCCCTSWLLLLYEHFNPGVVSQGS